jgi:hypothetical protein
VRDLCGDKLAKCLRCAASRLGADLGKSFADRRFLQCLVDGAIESRDRFLGRAALDRKADPVLHDQGGKTGFDDCRNIRENRYTFGAGYGERAQLAGFDQIDHRQHGDEHERVGAVQQVADCLRKLGVRNVLRARARQQFELFADQMRRRAKAARRKRELVGLAFQ